MKDVVGAAVALSMFALQVSAAGAQVAIQPSGKWGVDYRPDRCVLYRGFGEDQSGKLFAVSVTPGLRKVDVLIQNLDDSVFKGGKLRVTSLPSGVESIAEDVMSESKGQLRRLKFQISAETLEGLKQASELVIEGAGASSLRLAINSSPAVLAAVNKCETALLTSWGVDPSRFRRVQLPGEPGFVDRSGFFGPNTYPAEAMRANAEGRNVSLLEIGPSGEIKSCRTIISSQSEPLDNASCTIEKRFTYEPLKDAKGEAITSWTMYSVRWQRMR